MHSHDQALTHSPAIWGLYGCAAAAAGVLALTVGWNVWEYRLEVVTWIRDRARL